jgi:uncharacterized protein (DUF58 family)
MQPFRSWYVRFSARLDSLLNRRLAPGRKVRLRLRWPLYLLPIFLFSQIVTPHPVWLILSITLIGFYTLGYLWTRALATEVTLSRSRVGTILVAGDSFSEEFTLANASRYPLVWAEFVDASDLPGYDPSRIVASGAVSSLRWKTDVECERRGLYRIGPHRLNFGDLFGLFSATVDFPDTDMLLIYPRVVQLPRIAMPRGNAAGSDRRRRSMQGIQPAASVRDYQVGDSLRHIHWPTSAHRGDLAVKEMELEPSGDVWIVLDLNRRAHSGQGAESTLEYAIIVAASLAAALLDTGEQRAVGLLAASGPASTDRVSTIGNKEPTEIESDGGSDGQDSQDSRVVLLTPQRGRAQLWRVLSALAPVELSDVPIARLLRQSASVLGRRRSLVVVTPDLSGKVGFGGGLAVHTNGKSSNGSIDDEPGSQFGAPEENEPVELDGVDEGEDWAAELLHLQALGLHSSALLITAHVDGAGDHLEASQAASPAADGPSQSNVQDHAELRALLNRLDVPAELLAVDTTLPPLLTYRRTRKDIVSTPTGGVVVREIEEEVG